MTDTENKPERLSPVATLVREHDLIKTMLAVLSNICERIESDGDVKPNHLALVVDFIREFADRFHHAKEEKILFAVLEQARVADEDGLVASLWTEHTLGRGLVDLMDDAAGERALAKEFAEAAQSLVLLLAHHICREDKILFPSVEQNLKPGEQADLARRFETAERELSSAKVWAKHDRLVKELRAEYGVAIEIVNLCK